MSSLLDLKAFFSVILKISLICCFNFLPNKKMSNEVNDVDEKIQQEDDDLSETSENVEEVPSEVEVKQNEDEVTIQIEAEAEQSEIDINQEIEEPISIIDNTQIEEPSIVQQESQVEEDVVISKKEKLKNRTIKSVSNKTTSIDNDLTLKEKFKGLRFYSLPPTIGYENHDITKTRSPMWSFGEFGAGRSARK
jgi:hypothetical protein